MARNPHAITARPAPATMRRAAAMIRDIDAKHASVSRLLEAIADGQLHVHSAVHIAPADIIGNHQVRRLCGGVTRATLLRWRDGVGVDRQFPPPLKTIGGVDLWNRTVVAAWVAEHRPTERTR